MANPIQLSHASSMQMNSKSANQNMSLHCIPQDTQSLIPRGGKGSVRKKWDVLGKEAHSEERAELKYIGELTWLSHFVCRGTPEISQILIFFCSKYMSK